MRKVISEKTSKKVREALENVVSNGTGRTAYIEGYRVGGKTGTAQKVENGRYLFNNYILSFIGFLPANNPKVIVYFAIDNPKGVPQFGGVIAGPPAKSILEASINALNIKKVNGGNEKKYNYNDKKYIEVSDVTGMSLKEAKENLKNFEVVSSGNGDKITYQSPSAGSKVTEGSKIRVYMGDE